MRQKNERKLRSPSPATVMSALALFISLSGVGYAASKIGSSQIRDNSVRSKDIKNSTIVGKDIKGGTVASSDIKNSTVGLKDLGADTLIALQSPPNRILRKGERIFGTYAVQGQGPNLWTGVTFPVPAATPVDSKHVVIANNDVVDGSNCNGSKTNPVSGPGFVCIYTNIAANTTSGFGWGALCSCGDPATTGDGSRFGFIVQANGGAGVITASGIWVYTAP
jgi:hypothetical protein